MNRQLDLFIAAPESPLIGLRVKLDRPVDRDRPCCRNICCIGNAKVPHVGELMCADCGQPRGWLSKSTARWIEEVVLRFGVPTTPIVVRKSYDAALESTNGALFSDGAVRDDEDSR